MMESYAVYARVDGENRIVEVGSDAFLTDLTGWVKIDEGRGDRFRHAQNNYLPGPLTDERGLYRYRLESGEAVERTQDEMDADFAPPEPSFSDTELALVELAALTAENAARLDEQDAALVELAALIAGKGGD